MLKQIMEAFMKKLQDKTVDCEQKFRFSVVTDA